MHLRSINLVEIVSYVLREVILLRDEFYELQISHQIPEI